MPNAFHFRAVAHLRLRLIRSSEMMQVHVFNAGANRVECNHAALHFHSAVHQHDCALDNRSADHVLRLRDPVLGADQPVRIDRAIGILPNARSQRPAQFQNHGNDLRGCSARREFLLFFKIGPAHSYDFEVAVLLFFLLTVFGRQMFARLRHDEPLQTMAYTLFGLLYVLWLFNFITKIVYLTPRSSAGQLTGQFYVLFLIAVTKFADMGAYLTGSVIGRHLMVPHISGKKTWE